MRFAQGHGTVSPVGIGPLDSEPDALPCHQAKVMQRRDHGLSSRMNHRLCNQNNHQSMIHSN